MMLNALHLIYNLSIMISGKNNKKGGQIVRPIEKSSKFIPIILQPFRAT